MRRNICENSKWGVFIVADYFGLPLCMRMQDIIKMIIQYLQDEGYFASMMTIQDEANVRVNEHLRHRSQFKRIKTAIMGTSHVQKKIWGWMIRKKVLVVLGLTRKRFRFCLSRWRVVRNGETDTENTPKRSSTFFVQFLQTAILGTYRTNGISKGKYLSAVQLLWWKTLGYQQELWVVFENQWS